MKRAALILLLITCITNCKTIEPPQRNTPEPLASADPKPTSEKTASPKVDQSFVSEEFRDFVPEVISRDLLLDYNGFVLEFDTLTQHARWVSYLLCKENLGHGEERSSNFRMEKRLGDHSPRDASYKNSGYDRGHLAPAADMSYSTESMYDSFYLTNASPQVPGFNRGIWKRLEEQIRKFASEKDTIYIATGPILKENLPRIANSRICIPEYYYKVILKKDSSNPQGIAFIMKNESASGDLANFAITIDSVEVMTGINFFPMLDAKQEAQAESKVDMNYWFRN